MEGALKSCQIGEMTLKDQNIRHPVLLKEETEDNLCKSDYKSELVNLLEKGAKEEEHKRPMRNSILTDR